MILNSPSKGFLNSSCFRLCGNSVSPNTHTHTVPFPNKLVFSKGCIYLFERDSEREQERGEEGEAGSLLSREPNVGLNPRMLES